MKKLIPIAFLAVVFVGCSRRVLDMPSPSMEPTIPAGSKIIFDLGAYSSTAPARFDIVAFRPPSPPNATFSFRVIGLPGETIQLTEQAVLINGKEITPPHGLKYVPAPAYPVLELEHFPLRSGINQTNLSATDFFLLGDNSKKARDCRYFGPVHRSNILGKVIRIIRN